MAEQAEIVTIRERKKITSLSVKAGEIIKRCKDFYSKDNEDHVPERYHQQFENGILSEMGRELWRNRNGTT